METKITSEKLVEQALVAREKAIAPYSNYTVGAALLTSDGTVITAGNIESSTYGLTLCAERVAMFSALADGYRDFEAIAIATRNGGSPCGSCRQILWEFAGNIPVYLTDENRNIEEAALLTLLPKPFDKSKLKTSLDL